MRSAVLSFLVFLSLSAFGQQSDSLMVEVTILDQRIRPMEDAYRPFSDEVVRQALSTQQGTTTLQYTSLDPIRNYGPANIATLSVNGLPAAHSPLQWKGMNWQNPQLGLSDFSLVYPYLFDLDFANPRPQQQTNSTATVLSSGSPQTNGLAEAFLQSSSLRNHKLGAKGAYAQGKHHFGANGILDFARNQAFRSTQSTSEFGQKQQYGASLQHEFADSNRQWSNAVLALQSDRHLPKPKQEQFTDQADRQLGYVGHLAIQMEQWQWDADLSALVQGLAFRDNSAQIYSRSTSSQVTPMLRGQRHFWNKRLSFAATAAVSHFYVSSNALESDKSEARPRFHLDMCYGVKGLTIALGLKQELRFGERLPLSPSLSYALDLKKWLNIFGNGKRLYRLPTFNDLYWPSLGNPKLEPENGWSAEQGLRTIFPISALQLKIQTEAVLFYNKLHQALIWQPATDGIFRPSNLNQLQNQGVKLQSKFGFERKALRLTAIVAYQRLWSQTMRGNSQVATIFMPQETTRTSFSMRYKRLDLTFAYRWTGFQFTATDLSATLPAYATAFAQASYMVPIKEHALRFYLGSENLFNAQYQTVPGQPMPPQDVFLGLNFQLSKPKK